MFARADSSGELWTRVAALCDALVRESRALYLLHPHTPPLVGRVRYAPATIPRGVCDALSSGEADCVSLAAAECGRLQAEAVPARVVLSTTPAGAVHARVVLGSSTVYDPARESTR